MPDTTSPNAEYWLSRKVESFTTMKNCEEAELGSAARASSEKTRRQAAELKQQADELESKVKQLQERARP